MSNPAAKRRVCRCSGCWRASVVPLAAVAVSVVFKAAHGCCNHGHRDHLGDKNRVDFAAIDCAAPPGMAHADFLSEVQYLAGLPDRLEPSDELIKKLFTAFAHHPWVAEVKEIRLLPEQRVRVGLVFRTPVLAVEHGDRKHAVDGYGIRLPDAAPTAGLPVLRRVAQPRGPAGTVWGDEAASRRSCER